MSEQVVHHLTNVLFVLGFIYAVVAATYCGMRIVGSDLSGKKFWVALSIGGPALWIAFALVSICVAICHLCKAIISRS